MTVLKLLKVKCSVGYTVFFIIFLPLDFESLFYFSVIFIITPFMLCLLQMFCENGNTMNSL